MTHKRNLIWFFLIFGFLFLLSATAEAKTKYLTLSNKGKAIGNLSYFEARKKAKKYNNNIYPEKIYRSLSTPNDFNFFNQWSLGNNWGTNTKDAWDVYSGVAPPVIGVIDSGINYNHPDLIGNLWENTGEANSLKNNGVDDDNDGYIDNYNGINLTGENISPSGMDNNGHGSHVAGIISATRNNEIGIAGISNSKIMSIKILDANGTGNTSGIINGINFALSKNVRIFNLSLGTESVDEALYTAMKNAADNYDALFIVAAGNSSTDNDQKPIYPASFDLNNIISVASIGKNGSLSSFSNYGINSVDLGAPGDSLISTVLGNDYDFYSGTSMAAPMVTGAVALIKSQRPDLLSSTIKNIILQNTRPLSSNSISKVYSGGTLDTYLALNTSKTASNDLTNPIIIYKLKILVKRKKKYYYIKIKNNDMREIKRIKFSFNSKFKIKEKTIKVNNLKIKFKRKITFKPQHWKNNYITLKIPRKNLILIKGKKCASYTITTIKNEYKIGKICR